ncbi:MAG: glycosyltransferase [Bryobacterales bacterium]|nr:glycosyltransferase [Bryobacterales bacterium]
MALVFLDLTAQLIRTRPTHILVQNPPSFPTLASAWLAARLQGSRLIVDWHNYGYSMLALRLGHSHPFVRLAAVFEGWMARRADRHLCVSRAMASDLHTRFGISAEVLYDAPFRMENANPNQDGCVVVVSPCGWTTDERVDCFLDALDLLRSDPLRHRLRIHLTGDGPLRAGLEPRIAMLRHAGFAIHTGFLSEADYRALLRGASVGVSLHESSSALDLAMKNVDLLAASVPVCALDYGGSLSEQIRQGENGYLFRTADDLARLLRSFLAAPAQLHTMRETMRKQPATTWGREWNRVALPLLVEGWSGKRYGRRPHASKPTPPPISRNVAGSGTSCELEVTST